MRSRWSALLLIAVLGFLFFTDLVLHPSQTLYADCSDLLTLHLPSRHFLVRSWQETGELPLWCPYNFAGLPCVHDIQVSAFYPPHWPLLVLPEHWLGAALSWLVVLHVIAAGWCMYGYARHQRLNGTGALVAAVGYMFAGKWLLHVLAGGHYNMVPLAWLPLVLWGLERAIRRRSLMDATWAGAAYALIILGAYPYVTLYAGLFVALWTLGTALEEAGYLGHGTPGPRGATVRVLGRWAGLGAWTALVAVALGAVQLLPGLEFSAGASRSAGVGVSSEVLLDGLRSLVGLVGPALANEPNWWESRAGVGVLWLTLAAAAPLVGGRRTRFQAGVLLVLVVFALGGAVTVQWLPGFSLFRLPSRMLLVAALPVALLAGRTVQAVLTGSGLDPALRARCRGLLLKVTAVVVVLAGVFALALRAKQGGLSAHFHPYWAALLVTVPAAWWLLGARRSWFHAPAWLALLLVDLCTLTWPLVDVRPEAEVYAGSPCVGYLAGRRGEHGRVLDFNPLSYETAANHTPLWPGLPVVQGIEAVRGFNPIDILRYKEYLQFITDEDKPLRALDPMFTKPILGTFAVKNQGLADLLGIRYLVQPADLPLEATVPTGQAAESWVGVMDDPCPTTFNFIAATPSGGDCGIQALPPYRVYENVRAFPRAFVVPEAAPLPERAEVLGALKATNFRRRVLLEGFPEGEVAPTSHPGRFREAAVREYLPNRVTLETAGGAAGYLVLADVWFPGWTCTVDGEPARVYRANYLFRAVELPAGAREVVFTFAPASYRWGKLISGAAVLGVLLLLLATFAPSLRPTMRVPEPKDQPHAVPC
jgi:hypothetical protein